MGASAAVLGASGYAGGEVLRYLAGHPAISVLTVASDSSRGRGLAEVHPHLRPWSDLELGEIGDVPRVDICFSCLPHGVLPEIVDEIEAAVIVDLAEDHRGDRSWTYGLPELDRARSIGATRISNPGCYPTAALLALVPFARAQLLGEVVIVDALSGVSGAGRKPRDELLYASLADGVSAYGSVEHRHVAEIENAFRFFAGVQPTVSFTPHLVPMSRGLLVTARSKLTAPLSDEAALNVLEAEYNGEFFVDVVAGWPNTKAVSGTNRAQVSARVDARAGFLVCSAAIDNLGKGAAGQAIQNANLALGLEETTGLEMVTAWP